MADKFSVPGKLKALTEKAPTATAQKYLTQLDAISVHLDAADTALVALGDEVENDESAEDALTMIDDALDKLVRVRSVVTRTRSKFR